MTPAELPAFLEGLKERVAASMVPVCDAIGDAYKNQLVDYTLIESGAHPPASEAGYPPAAPPGRPPMLMTGRLRDTVVKTPAAGDGGVAECSVFPTVIYAGTQEYGGVHTGKPLMWLWVRYVGPKTVVRKNWRLPVVVIRPHPYMSTAVDESVANGRLTTAAVEGFEAAVWG